MAHFTQRLRNKDPFSVQPVPKSFYFPSPKKYVETSEPIQAPQYAVDDDAQRDVTELNKNNNGGVVHSSSTMFKNLPTALPKYERSVKKDESDTHYDEIWPDSERPSSPSVNENTSALTAAADSTISGESSLDLQEAVDRLEFYDRYKSKTTSRSESREGGFVAEKSTLQKYIERFRNSEPKSRQERMQEMPPRKQEFWWLQADSHDKNDPASVPDKFQQHNAVKKSKESENEPQLVKLTKEALTAMDEATVHLQAKADRLLSKSEMSVSSSGPIVSTDGLGTSCSVSDQSTIVDAPSYRPAFINVREHCKEYSLPNVGRKVQDPQSSVTSKLNSGDILAQWRFRRRIEEAQDRPTVKADLEPVHLKPHKNSEMDARLEEFRKRLLSQRMLVTPSDIQFERQKMDMLMEKNEEQSLQEQTSSDQSQLPRDPVLERLQGITKNKYQQRNPSFSNNVSKAETVREPVVGIGISFHTDNTQDNNKNNSSLRYQQANEISLANSSDLMLNKNNTASSNFEGLEDKHYSVDNMEMIVICDAKSKVHDLRDPEKESNVKNDKHLEKYKDVDALSKTQKQSNRSDSESKPDRSKRPLRDLPLNQISSKSVPGKELQRKDSLSIESPRKKQEKDVTHGHIYHQYLQAEKPSSENAASENFKGTDSLSTCSLKKINSHDKSASETEDLVQSDNSAKSQSSRGKNSSSNMGYMDTAHVKKTKRRNFSKSSSKKVHQFEEKSDSSDCDIYPKQPELRNKGSAISSRSLKEQRLSSSKKHQPVISTLDKEKGGIHNVEDHSDANLCQNEETNVGHSRKGVRAREKDDRLFETCSESQRFVNAKGTIGQAQVSAQPVKSVIGQTVRDHMFDGSLLLSSVDSWASAFPPSPVPAHRSQSSEVFVTKTPSPVRKTSDSSASLQTTPNQSTPLERFLVQNGADSCDEDSHSPEEFREDPLLNLLRQQRAQYMQKLELIEYRLQELDNK